MESKMPPSLSLSAPPASATSRPPTPPPDDRPHPADDPLSPRADAPLGLPAMLLSTVRRQLDRLISPATQSHVYGVVTSFARTRPLVFSFLLVEFILAIIPVLLFVNLTLSTFVFACVLALLFTLFWVGIATLFLVPTLCVTGAIGIFVWAWAIATYSAGRRTWDYLRPILANAGYLSAEPHQPDQQEPGRQEPEQQQHGQKQPEQQQPQDKQHGQQQSQVHGSQPEQNQTKLPADQPQQQQYEQQQERLPGEKLQEDLQNQQQSPVDDHAKLIIPLTPELTDEEFKSTGRV
ncbi:hypothetical protein QBC42DRAFT_2370 [Cladorrhinum samala]|uniref:Uncharacterized protein n=1 Tax=Cladorrhinum samala TaxID=585594 RepID=A0AAV9I2E9_9PEZI|nr:hypothetical protein QBC42DRAFT_2370 [Cladorrhinum samala]